MSRPYLVRLHWVSHPVWGDGWLRCMGMTPRGVQYIFMVDNTSAVFTAQDLIDHNIQPFHSKANKEKK